MKILLIDIQKEKFGDSVISFNTSLLKDFTELTEDLEIRTSFESAYAFINENLIEKKKYIDLILVHAKLEDVQKANDFSNNIRKSEDTYFNGYFNISSICIVLIADFIFHDKVIESNLFNRIISCYWKEHRFIGELGLAITEWRQKLAGELDELNINLDLDFKNFNSEWALRTKLYKLNILTVKFINDKNQFSFIWLGEKLSLIDYSVNEFQQLLKSNTRQKEKKIHEFLKKNEKFLLGEYKSSFNYEKHLYYKGSMKYIEADFFNYSHPYYLGNHEVFEVKLSGKKIIKENGKDFYSYFNNYLNQVNKYFTYLTDPINFIEIENKLDIKIQDFDYTMLFSRNEYVNGYSEKIFNKINSLPFNMRMITYDDLINRFERFYERTKKFGVR